MADRTITTVARLRASFWANHSRLVRVPGRTQNDYPVDTRMAWVEYVDAMARDGSISEALARRATL